jgi:hypothetical protein
MIRRKMETSMTYSDRICRNLEALVCCMDSRIPIGSSKEVSAAY